MSLLSQALFERYPHSIRSTLLDDRAFKERLGLQATRVFRFSDTVSVRDEQLFSAVRAALRECKESSFEGLRGKKGRIRVSAGDIEISVEGSERPPVSIPELFVLSSNAAERTRSIQSIIDQCGPTAPDFSNHLKTGELRDLTDAEVSEMLAELHNGIAAYVHNAAAAFDQGQAGVADLVPSDLTYFERFCGPNPGTTDLQTYVTDVLPAYRSSLINRNLSVGLDICLIGALRQDLCPGPWLESISDNDVWEALKRINFWHDPYSLLGVLDLALRRHRDRRFQELAAKVVGSLRTNSLPDNDGNDAYDLMPLFAQLTLDRLDLMDGGVQRAPFWKRMCAWMHGGMLARLSRNSGLDTNGMKEWIQGRISRAGVVAQMLDLRREPMFSALLLTKAALRGEVVGRLGQIYATYIASPETSALVQRIEKILQSKPNPELPFMSVSPGPLEGNRRPQVSHEGLLSSQREDLLAELRAGPVGPVWSWLAQLAQAYRLDKELLAAGRDAIRDAVIPDDTSLGRLGLSDALLVAISTPDVELRDVVTARLVGIADRIKSHEDGALIVQTVVLASATTENDGEWEKWLANTLADVAVRLPLEREGLLGFISTLEAVEKVVPKRAGITARAKAITTAAV
jgi:hypothetical protein